MAIVQEINLNMIPDSMPVIVRVDQYDTGEGRIVAHLYEGPNAYTPAAGSTAIIQGTKPDKHGFSYDATLNGSTVIADLVNQMSCVGGNTRCQFVITEPSGRTGTFAFVLKVQDSALADDTDVSETVLPAYIDAAQRAAAEAEEASKHYPYIDMTTLHWMVWDVEQKEWIDTEVPAIGTGLVPGTGIKITDDVISVDADSAPTENSLKPVTSGGIYDALETKQDNLSAGTGIDITNDVVSVDADSTPTENSVKPVTSGGVYDALATKQGNLTAGANIQISANNEISATDTTYENATDQTAGLMSAADKAKLDGIAAGAEVNVQADWSEADNTKDDYIKNKPNLATVATSGEYSDLLNKPTLGTAAAKNSTNAVTAGSTDLVESGAVKDAIDAAVVSAYKEGGTKTCAELTSALLIAANRGLVYNITDDGTTTADFVEGAGHPIKAGDNVGVTKVGNAYKFDLLSGFVDTSGLQTKALGSAIEGQSTVEGALSALSTNKQPKTMSAAITVDGTAQSTVEGTLNALNTLAAANKTNKQDKSLASSVEGQSTVEGALGTLSTNKQPKTLSSPITVDGTQETTVEAALGAINTLTAGINEKIPSNASTSNKLVTQSDVDLGLLVKNGKLCVRYSK